MEGTGLDLADEGSSKFDMIFSWRGLVFMMKEVCLSREFSRNFTCFFMVLCVNKPPAVRSRHRSDSMS